MRALAFLPTAQPAYCQAAPLVSRRYNQAFFTKLYVDDEYVITSDSKSRGRRCCTQDFTSEPRAAGGP